VALRGRSMQYPEYRVPRISLPRTPVNKRRQPPALPHYYATPDPLWRRRAVISSPYRRAQRFSLRPAWPSPAVESPTPQARRAWSART
jgi:hypothetical protein